jgi:N-acetylglucosamine-6-phosphate deacetylase
MGELVARDYRTGAPIRIEWNDSGRITSVSLADNADAPPSRFVSPGFIDLQINGYGGLDFTSPKLTVDEVVRISLGLDRHGTTGYLATLTTHSSVTFEHALRVIDQACREREEAARRILGVHVEGPYISAIDGPRGAHPREHCREPDWNEFQRWQAAAGGRIKLVTVSPEYDAMPDFIRRAVASGVLVAIGHTNANTEQIAAAVEAGARMSTHLGNGAHPQIRRHPNYIWDQLADDRLTASIIADGHHLPANVVKCFLRAKGIERTVLVSDITGMAGMPPGRYHTMLGDVEVLEGGKLVVAGQLDILAGASLPLEHCAANVMRFAGVDLKTAVEMATVGPLRLLGESLEPFAVGTPANLVVFDVEPQGPLRIRATYHDGAASF